MTGKDNRVTQRFLNPSLLASLSGLDLVAKTVVDGFVSGLHKSPDFGFSQEFAEYRAYSPGDDLRHIDWNVYARSEKMYLKRYRGETNTLVTILLDTSASMSFGSHSVNKLEYAKFAASSIAYLANQQRDGIGLIVFDDDVRLYIQPSGRQGQLQRILHGIEHAQPGVRTDFAKPFLHCMEFLKRRGLVVVLSDFYEQPDSIVKAISPLGSRGNEVSLFHVLDPEEIKPTLNESSILLDMETQQALEVSPDYTKHDYIAKVNAHIASLREKALGSRMEYCLLDSSRPLDAALREYLAVRVGRF